MCHISASKHSLWYFHKIKTEIFKNKVFLATF
jgi:hypothetical protein